MKKYSKQDLDFYFNNAPFKKIFENENDAANENTIATLIHEHIQRGPLEDLTAALAKNFNLDGGDVDLVVDHAFSLFYEEVLERVMELID